MYEVALYVSVQNFIYTFNKKAVGYHFYEYCFIIFFNRYLQKVNWSRGEQVGTFCKVNKSRNTKVSFYSIISRLGICLWPNAQG